jgi:hypothetical protein
VICFARLSRKDEEFCSLGAPCIALPKRLGINRQPLDRPTNHPIEPRPGASAVAILKAVGSAITAKSGCFRMGIKLILRIKLDTQAPSLC